MHFLGGGGKSKRSLLYLPVEKELSYEIIFKNSIAWCHCRAVFL